MIAKEREKKRARKREKTIASWNIKTGSKLADRNIVDKAKE
jgi:hypothetical protein